MKNLDIRQALKENNIKHWQLADALNIAEFTLCRKLRHELSKEQKENIFAVIEQLKKENKQEVQYDKRTKTNSNKRTYNARQKRRYGTNSDGANGVVNNMFAYDKDFPRN